MDKYLKEFKKNNPIVNIKEELEHYNIENAWGDNTFILRLKKEDNFSLLENIELQNEFSAIFHRKDNKYEFIFTPIKEDDEIISRNFEFIYDGKKFKAYYASPTENFVTIATAFREIDSSSFSDYRNLLKFRDFYKQERLPEFIKRYFKNRIPINFFVEGPFNEILDIISFFKNLNFYMSFFDRKSPQIVIFDDDDDDNKEKYKQPCLTKNETFPEIISSKNIDTVLLDLFHIAKQTQNIRLKYIFYFQVLEYCSYYYLNNDLKRKLNNIIRNPDILQKSDNYSQYIIEEFKNFFKPNDDSKKIEKVIIDYCEFSDIKNEIAENYEFFMDDIEFEGGFKISGIINSEKDIETPPKNIMQNIKSNIEKIRNVLVHIRESRENLVILPTEKNNKKLYPYLYLLRRISEIVAFRYE